MDRYTEGNWLIHGPKYRKDNHSQDLKHPCMIPLGM